ncbi:MAG: hypothetical protein RIB71_25655 [Imperialibacter sp.]|uniref:hypothetical protein n=1 Tax=Imperialibacter sp. TaxID=2038411 RepID=UPI0032EBA539
MKIQIVWLCLLFLALCAPSKGQISDSAYTTQVELLAKKQGKWEKRLLRHRLQLTTTPDGKTDLKAHPVSNIKNLRFSLILEENGVKQKVKPKQVVQTILSRPAALPLATKLSMDEQTYEKNQQKYNDDLLGFTTGKRASRWVYSQWITLAQWEAAATPSEISVLVKRPFRKVARLTLEELRTISLPYLPTLSNIECVPIDRFFELRKLKGYGIDKITYQPYTGHDQDILKRRQRIYFPKNKYEPESVSIDSLRKYLNDNDLSILKADFYGYSSLEGDSLLNRNLQEKRASFLYKMLDEMSSDPVEADSIGFDDGYEALVALAKKNSIKWLQAMPKAQLKDTLQKDSLLLARLEPLLQQSRKAELQLVLAKRLNKEERIDKAFRVLNQTAYRVVATRSGHISTIDQQRVSGILHYLFRIYVGDEITSDELVYAVNAAPNAPFVRVLFMYMFIEQFERKRPIQVDSLVWHNKLAEFDLDRLFEAANEDIIALLYSKTMAANTKAMLNGMAVDLQYYTFKYIINGSLSPSVLCRFSYPNTPGFYALKLNHYAFLQQLPPNLAAGVNCYSGRSYEYSYKGANHRFRSTEVEGLAERLEQSAATYQSTVENGNLEPPSFYKGFYSDYYFFLKVLFINEDETMLRLVNQSDQLLEFDLYHFIDYQVESFDPVHNFWLDEDIPIQKMQELVRRLARDPGRLCPVLIENISLSFYLKTLYYLNNYYDPTSPYHMALARDALSYISSYYRNKKAFMTPELENLIQRQINFFHLMPGTKDISEYAID